jgi:PTH1 family peptidyl-tRNA hydrolase
VAHVVVGLGNPGPEYQGTRHNVGQRVLDALAARLRATWRRAGQAIVSQGQWRGDTLHLVKPESFMNLTGGPVAVTLRRLHAAPADVILVYDDIDLPLGTVRVRMKGSHGGHNGVRSVIEALGTSDIRRVKVGIGRPEHKGDVPDHVLTGFEPDEMPTVEQAVEDAVERVLTLVRTPIGS